MGFAMAMASPGPDLDRDMQRALYAEVDNPFLMNGTRPIPILVDE
jgi:hypothetical protein